jgi:glucose-1-phosphate cytidylyltransferase
MQWRDDEAVRSADVADRQEAGTRSGSATDQGLHDVPVFILCGGKGTRLGDRAAERPKPMVEIGQEPILVHIMRHYRRYGFRNFVLCAGHRGDVISNYFLNFNGISDDFTIELETREVTIHARPESPDWRITVAHTGHACMTGARVARAAMRYLDGHQTFAVTYGDGLTDVDLDAELGFHRDHGKFATFLGVNPPSQFGRFELNEDGAATFQEKPKVDGSWVNGGFFFFERAVLDYLSEDQLCVLEQEPLARLAQDDQLRMFPHEGFWSCIDTPRDHDMMCSLWNAGDAPWAQA